MFRFIILRFLIIPEYFLVSFWKILSSYFQILFLVHFNSFLFVRFQLEVHKPVTIPHKSLILYSVYSAFFILSSFALVRIFSSEPFSSSLNLYSGISNPLLSQFFELSSSVFCIFFFLLLAFQFNFIS